MKTGMLLVVYGVWLCFSTLIIAGCKDKGDSQHSRNKDAKSERVVEVPSKVNVMEVSVFQYKRCVDAGACSSDGLTTPSAPEAQKHARFCNWGKPGREHYPMNCVNWEHARVYCAWEGKLLPTEIDWEKAAREFDWIRNYPDNIRGHIIEYARRIAREAADGAYPAEVLDTLDLMVGGMWEWTADWEVENKSRPLRGGSWLNMTPQERVAHHGGADPAGRGVLIGFRCTE